MANLSDYLAWRGDLPFAADGFNEVDNVVLSELAYADWTGPLPDGGVALAMAARRYLRRTSRQERAAKAPIERQGGALLQQAARTRRFASVRVTGFVNRVDAAAQTQMAALTFVLPDGSAYVAYRGTDNTLVGWQEDFNLSYLPETGGQRLALAYLAEAARGHPGALRVGGHSKGGNFAVYAAAFARPSVQARILAVYANDGPGFRREITRQPGYRRLLPRVRSLVPAGTIIGGLLVSGWDHRVVASDSRGIWQHDAMTWQVRGRHFVPAARTGASLFFETTLSRWIAHQDDESRRRFTEALFAVLGSGGDTVEALGANKFAAMRAMAGALREMPRGEQEQFFAVLADLVKTGGAKVGADAQEAAAAGARRVRKLRSGKES